MTKSVSAASGAGFRASTDTYSAGVPFRVQSARPNTRWPRWCRNVSRQPADGRALFFVVEADRSQLAEIAERVRTGRLRTNIGAVRPLSDAVAAFNEPSAGKIIITTA